LTGEAIERIAQAAAGERHHLLDPRAGEGGQPIELVPVDDPGSAPARRRWPALLTAAAAAAVVVVAVGSLSRPDQTVLTQEGAGRADPTGAEPPAADAADVDSRTGADRVLDLGDAVTTTTTIPPPSSPSTSPSSTAPSSTAGASSPPPPASTPPTVSSTVPPSTEGSAVTTEAADRPGGTDDGAAPATGDGLDVVVGAGGTVTLRLVESRVELVDVVDRPGWSHTVDGPSGGRLTVVFADGSATSSLTVRSDPGRFHLSADHGGARPSRTEWTRTWTLGQSGSVLVSYGAHGLSELDVRLVDGWQHRIDTKGPDRLRIRLVDPRPGGRYDAGLVAGPVTIDLVVAGS
jgi:hypothetical protein